MQSFGRWVYFADMIDEGLFTKDDISNEGIEKQIKRIRKEALAIAPSL